MAEKISLTGKTNLSMPENAKIFETDIVILWLDENGILCVITKKNVSITKSSLVNLFEIIGKLSGGNKICMVDDMSFATWVGKEERDYIAEQALIFFKAVALIANSPLSKMIANIFLYIKKLPYPTKLFTDENEAKKWLTQYL